MRRRTARPSFRDNVVIITGASSGIGRELAYQLADQGARLVLAARDAARLEETAAQCRMRGGKTLVVPTDVADQAQCADLVDRALEKYGCLDTLVNNAGISMWARFENLDDPAILDQIMRVNYMGSVYCTFYALPYLRRTRGRIIAIASVAGRTGVPTRSGYAASKHALTGFFDSLRIELAGSGVSVTLVYPDFVASEMRVRALGADGRPLARTPVHEPQVMPVEECARLIVDAAARRKREVLMSRRSKIGVWLKLIAPGLVDRIARRAIAQGR